MNAKSNLRHFSQSMFYFSDQKCLHLSCLNRLRHPENTYHLAWPCTYPTIMDRPTTSADRCRTHRLVSPPVERIPLTDSVEPAADAVGYRVLRLSTHCSCFLPSNCNCYPSLTGWAPPLVLPQTTTAGLVGPVAWHTVWPDRICRLSRLK